MLAQTERLGRLVEQLLDLSKLESGEVPLHLEPVPLAPLVDRVISEISVGRARRPTSELGADVAADLPPSRPTPSAIHQVLFNLVDNAVRFTPPGGGAVTIDGRA